MDSTARFPPIWVVHKTLKVHPVKSTPTGKTISKGVDGTDSETMDGMGSKITWDNKWGPFWGAYFSNTRPLLKVLHQWRLVQGWHGRSTYPGWGFSGGI